MLIGLFLLFRRISGSPRIAGLGTAIYVANANFLIFGAQYSYESLALPLLVVVAHGGRRAAEQRRGRWQRWATFPLATTAAVAHAPSVLLCARCHSRRSRSSMAIGGSCAGRTRGHMPSLRSGSPRSGLGVAQDVVGYLGAGPRVTRSKALGHLTGQSDAAALFEHHRPESVGEASPTPLLGQDPVDHSVAVLTVGLPLGPDAALAARRLQPFSIFFAVGAVAYFATLALRFATSSWETGEPRRRVPLHRPGVRDRVCVPRLRLDRRSGNQAAAWLGHRL